MAVMARAARGLRSVAFRAFVVSVIVEYALLASADVLLSPGQHSAEIAAVAKAEQLSPGRIWHVTHVQLVLVPYNVYDSNGRLREVSSRNPCIGSVGPPCPPRPKWVIELAGIYAKAIVDVDAIDGWVGDSQMVTNPGDPGASPYV